MSYQEDRFAEIANAIREKDGTTEPILATDFATRILEIPSGSGETDYTTMQELFNIMLTVPKIDVDINEFEMGVDYPYFTYYASYSQLMNTEYVYGDSLLAEIYYISSDFEIFGTSTYSMNDGFNCDPQGGSTDLLAVDYLSFNGYIVVVYRDASPDRTIYCYSQFNMNILNDYAMISKDFDMLQLSFYQGDYIKIQVIGEDFDYSIQIENEGDMYLTPDVLGLDTYNVFDFENVTFKVQYFYENGIACSNLYEV